MDDTLREARERAAHRAHDPERRAALRAVDHAYVSRAVQRRDEVHRLRLTEGLPRDLGGRRQPTRPDTHRAAIVAAQQHLAELGLRSEVTDQVGRQDWWAAS